MPTNNRPTADDIDVVSMFGAIRRALRTLLVATVIVGATTYGILSTIAARYTSEAQLSISAKSTNPFPEKRDRQTNLAPRLDKEAINTHVRSIMAPDLIRKVAEQLQLKSRVEFNSALGSLDVWSRVMRMIGLAGPGRRETSDERVLRVIYSQLEVSAAHESRFIAIKFSSADPALAAAFANRLASTYREGLVSVPVKETSQVVTALQPKVDQLREELISIESKVERFRATTDQFRAGPQNTPLNNRRMSALSDELTRAEVAKSEAEARWSTARELAGSGSADVLPEVQKSPLIQNLINQRISVEREYSEASASLLPYHPRMRQLTANLKKLKQQSNAEVRKVVKSLEKDFRAAGLRADAAAARMAKLKIKVVNTSGNEAKLRALESEAKSKRTELERLQKQLEDNKSIVNIKQVPVEAQIISTARASSKATFPKKAPYSMLAMAATFLLGLAWIIFRELVSGAYGAATRPAVSATNAARSKSVPPQPTAVPSLAPSPELPRAQQAGVQHKPDQPSARQMTMAEIASCLAERPGVEKGYRTMLVGSGSATIRADLALDLASQLAGRGQSALIVDWDLAGQGEITRRLAASAPGLLEVLRGSASFEEVIRQLPGSGLHAIASGAPVAPDEDIGGLLDPTQLNLVLDALDEAYDQVIITAGDEDDRAFFEAIEGRVDAGIRIAQAGDTDTNGKSSTNFLGYDVEGIAIYDFCPPAAPAAAVRHLPQKNRSGLSRQA